MIDFYFDICSPHDGRYGSYSPGDIIDKSVKLRPTGRWMLEHNSIGICHLYIEHRYFWFLKEWIREDNIYEIKRTERRIFDCKR